MKILDRYILRQLIFVTLLGVVALSALLLLGELFKQLRPLLVESGAPPSIVMEFIFQVIPFSLTFSIPWGFLTAVLLVYGRLAADNELTSMRMAGLSLWRLSMPAIVFGIALSALCYYVNIEIAPKGKQAMADIVRRAAMNDPKSLLRPGQSITSFKNQQIFIDDGDEESRTLYGIHIYQLPKDGLTKMVVHAQKALVDFDEDHRILKLQMYDTFIEGQDKDGKDYSPFISEMPWEIQLPNSDTKKLKPNLYTNAEINALLADPEQSAKLTARQRLEFETEFPKRASFSVACIAFALIGVPLAVSARRRDTSTGFAMGILIASLYFVALVFSELSRKYAGPAPYWILWAPNIACLILAVELHRRARYRG